MAEYIYETHLHTREGSACGKLLGAEQADLYKGFGYTGIVVTDHFFNGNCAVPRDLPWKERVERFCAGYRGAKARGDEIGLQVFFGLETNFSGQEFLLYGISEEWLKEQEDMLSWSPAEQFEKVKSAGGFVVQAHPYREAPYIAQVRLYPDCCEAFEISNALNASRGEGFNERAAAYAREHGIPVTGGSDAHAKVQLRGGVVFEKKWESIEDYANAVRSGSGYRVITDFLER
ncbi:MAG: PHP domain-containing protein [Lachnospiraceae bacterium]|nr:PHP domain-containing protein [Lachnospiraceae bacterium]